MDPNEQSDYHRLYFPHWDNNTADRNGDDYDWGQRLDKERGEDWAVTHPENNTIDRKMQKKNYGWPLKESYMDAQWCRDFNAIDFGPVPKKVLASYTDEEGYTVIIVGKTPGKSDLLPRYGQEYIISP